jgi:apolipoprotein N-acyltransferase
VGLKDLWAKIRFDLRFRHLLAAVAGLLLAAAFPQPGVAGFAWITPGLMLLAAYELEGIDAFLVGGTAGLVSALAQFYWLLLIPVSWFPILGWVMLSAYLALYPALWVWLVAGKVGEGGWAQRSRGSIGGAALWVALEMVRARFLGGMPWNLLGVSQAKLTPLIQFASFTGVYGVSFLVLWFSLSLYCAVRMLLRNPSQRFSWQGEMFFPLLAVIAAYDYGLVQQHPKPGPPPPSLHVTFIQPSIPQTLIWNEAEDGARYQKLLAQTRDALLNHKTDLLLWPEAALPNVGQNDLVALTGLIRSQQVWMILGADDATPRPGGKPGDDLDYFNASFLFNPNGTVSGVYHKQKLVMFGEFVPATGWLPVLKHFTPITGSYTPGTRAVPFQAVINGYGVSTATLICFEDIFPHVARAAVGPDTDFLVNLSNDGWFGEGAAQWQQAANAAFRAVENGLPLLRCCNNGLTCWIDAHGNFQQILRDERGSVYGAGVMPASIPTLPPGERRVPTFYQQHGDVFGWVCTAIGALILWKRLPIPKRRKWGDF